jgi:hypothetical protein
MTTIDEHVAELLNLWTEATQDLEENSTYYEAEHRPQALGLAVPPPMRHLLAKIGWASLYLDSLEERLNVEGFRMAQAVSADDKLWEWWQANNMDTASSQAHLEAMIYGRCYVTVSAPDPTDPLSDKTSPVIRVESPMSVFAEIDESTQRVTRAIRVIEKNGQPRKVTLYLPNVTHFLTEEDTGGLRRWRPYMNAVEHKLGAVPVIPMLNKKRVGETYGKTEIRASIKSAIDAACRLMMDLQAAAELMAIPQRVLFGADFDELLSQTGGSKWEAYMANVLAFDDPDGKIQQFAAAELQNFVNGMRQLEKNVANDTGLPPQYLSFATDNPASADAIRASESRLVTKSERKCNIFGEAWEQVMRMAMLVMTRSIPKGAYRMETKWRNPATPSFASKADAVVKLATAKTPDGRAVIPLEMARQELGYTDVQRRQMEKWDRESSSNILSDLYGVRATEQPQTTQPEPEPAVQEE